MIHLNCVSFSQMLLFCTLLIYGIYALFFVRLLYRFNPCFVCFAFYVAHLLLFDSIVYYLLRILGIILQSCIPCFLHQKGGLEVTLFFRLDWKLHMLVFYCLLPFHSHLVSQLTMHLEIIALHISVTVSSLLLYLYLSLHSRNTVLLLFVILFSFPPSCFFHT